MVYRVPEVVIVSEVGCGVGCTAATVERKVEFAVFQVDGDEVNVLSVGQVKHDTVRCSSLYLNTQLCPARRHMET